MDGTIISSWDCSGRKWERDLTADDADDETLPSFILHWARKTAVQKQRALKVPCTWRTKIDDSRHYVLRAQFFDTPILFLLVVNYDSGWHYSSKASQAKVYEGGRQGNKQAIV